MVRFARLLAAAPWAVSLLLFTTIPASADRSRVRRSRSPASMTEVLAAGRAARRQVMTMLDLARQERDVVKVTCYDAKLSALNATIRNLEQSKPPRPPRLVEVTHERIRTLLEEARHCVCEVPAWVGGPRFAVEVLVDPRIPSEDPSEFP